MNAPERIRGPWVSPHNASAKLAGHEPKVDQARVDKATVPDPVTVTVKVTNHGKTTVMFTQRMHFPPQETKVVELNEKAVRRLDGFRQLSYSVM